MGLAKTEFELKFAGPPAVIAALPQSRFFRALESRDGAWERLCSTYYDTNDGALERRALSLRLREEGGALIQAVKRVHNGGAVARAEFETEIADPSLFPVPTGDPAIDEWISAHKGALGPVARTTVDRWSSILAIGESRIEFAADLGMAEGWGGGGDPAEAPLAEIELELIGGAPREVFELARLFSAHAPLRLSARTKLAFAASLRRGGLYEIEEEPRIALAPEMATVDALQDTLSGVAARIASLQPALIEARKAEAVHQMRIALRRLQAVERIFRPYLKTRKLHNLAQNARSYRQSLGDARDWDVFLSETLPAAARNNYAPEGAQRLRARAESFRAEAWSRAVSAVSASDFTGFLIDLTEAATIAPWRKAIRKPLEAPVRKFAPQALDDPHQAMLRIAKSIDRSHIAGYHPLRIALKKLRYPVQMFRPIYAKEKRKELMGAMAALQEAFGAINDAAVAGTLAYRAAADEGDEAMRAAGFICGYRAAEAEAAAQKIDAAWPSFAKMQPFWRD
jgi:inorganic triphosphatase YgiF